MQSNLSQSHLAGPVLRVDCLCRRIFYSVCWFTSSGIDKKAIKTLILLTNFGYANKIHETYWN